MNFFQVPTGPPGDIFPVMTSRTPKLEFTSSPVESDRTSTELEKAVGYNIQPSLIKSDGII